MGPRLLSRHLLVAHTLVVFATGCGSRTGLTVADPPEDATAIPDTAHAYEVSSSDADAETCPGAVCDGLCIDLSRDVRHCGVCFRECPAPASAIATCEGGSCGFVCKPGYLLADGACVPGPIRPIAPASTSTVTSLRPTLRWLLPPGADGAHVELCADRACSIVLAALDATGTSVRAPSNLPSGPVYFRLYARNAGVTDTVSSPTWEFFVGRRDRGVDASSGTTLDLNGDGYPDLATVFSNTFPTLTGMDSRVYIYLGTKTGLPKTPTRTISGLAAAKSSEVTAANVGDVNGDGYGDLVIALPAQDRLYLFLGSASGPSATPSATIKSPLAGRFGGVVAAAGDVDGDGFGDVIVRRDDPNGISTKGNADLFRGGPAGLTFAATLESPPPPPGRIHQQFGSSFASADLNADGYADVVVGAACHEGRTYVYLGSASGLPATPSIVLRQKSVTGACIADSVATSDVNGDGFADVAVSRLGIEDMGGTHVFLGNSTGVATESAVFLPAPSDLEYHTRVAAGGDINGDGYDELLAGWPNHTHAAAVYTGGPSGPSASRVTMLGGTGPWVWFGAVLARSGDLDGDGYGDIAVLECDDRVVGPTTKGKVYLYHGSSSGIAPSPRVELVSPDNKLTALAASAGP